MTEYIERDKALEEYDAWIESTGALPKGTSYYYECRGCIEEVPAADVEPVRHGRWVKYAGKLICSECKKYPPMKDESGGWRTYHEWPYCPNCGAKMDLECETR